jgi:hypothetical protein
MNPDKTMVYHMLHGLTYTQLVKLMDLLLDVRQ